MIRWNAAFLADSRPRIKKIDVGQTIQVLANIGVIAGIAFLAVEIRNQTSSIQSASVQAVTNASTEALSGLASDADLSRIKRQGDADINALDDDGAYRYFLFYRTYWLRFQNNYFQRDFGVLNASVWDTYARVVCRDIGVPGIRATWHDHSVVLDPKFVAFVESCPTFQQP